ncbi:MAG: FAD-dependent oxidoreductase [Clostridiales bacterium]|nr:FAD-dependent oxidoreductase [Clostridiales bacterium]
MKIQIKALLLALLILTAPGGSLITACGGEAVQARTPVEGPVIDGAEAYHVIVAGGEPEGVAAALAAARNGMKTLLVEKGDALGGLMTLGMLNFLDMNHGPKGELLTRGIFEEFYNALGNAFDVEEAKSWFLQKCQEESNLTLYLNTEILAPVMEGSQITGLRVRRDNQEEEVLRSLAVIDATVDADVAAAAGVPYTVGGEDYGAYGTLQGVTLVFELSGIDWQGIVRYLKNDGNSGTDADATAAWGYGAEAQKYQPVDANMRFRGPNIARQKNGNVLLNALIIFGVDALDPSSYAEGIARGRQEIPHIVAFMRENFPGFENAAFVDAAPRLYVRETRHIRGEYRLTITDILENRDHWDKIGYGSYPVDVQPTGPDNFGNVIGVPDIYSIPFRCLTPLEVDGLLVASRSASYDSIPHGSARVIPVGMVAGEACGTAAACAIREGLSFRQMSADEEAIRRLQEQLQKQGAYLAAYTPPRMAVMDHWAYPGVAVMREMGLTEGGYNNDYRLENELPNRWALQNKLNKLMRLAHERSAGWGEEQIPLWEVSLPDDEITLGEVFIATAQGASIGEKARISQWRAGVREQTGGEQAGGMQPASFSGEEEAKQYLLDRGILLEQELGHFSDAGEIAKYSQLLYLLGNLYTTLMNE